LVYPGSGGQTESEIAEIMGYPTDSTSKDVTNAFLELQSSIESTYDGSKMGNYSRSPRNSVIGIANKIYAAKDLMLKQSYINTLTANGDSEEDSFIDSNFDFASDDATQSINDWVNDNTNGLIEEIIDENTDISHWKLAALNAIYLNATFKLQFESYFTSKNSFFDSVARTNAVADCHLMHQKDYFDYFEDGKYQFLKFQFVDNTDLFALFVLPIDPHTETTKNGLITDYNVISNAISNLESRYIALALPKLSIEASYQLKEPLTLMGMEDAFGSDADFSGMSNESLFIDSVIHKTMVEMDENGLVAAAVTMIGMVKMSMPITTEPPPTLFKADHSFQMFIVDGEHENTVLFMGQINNPGIPEDAEEPTYDESADPIWTEYPVIEETSQEPIIYQATSTTSRSSMAVTVGVIVLVAAALVMVYGVYRTRKMNDYVKPTEEFQTMVDTDDEELDQFAGNTKGASSPSVDRIGSVDSSERALIN